MDVQSIGQMSPRFSAVDSPPAADAKKTDNDDLAPVRPVYDQYLSQDLEPSRRLGLYQIARDENGNRRIQTDDDKQEAKAKPDLSKQPDNQAQNCTADTNKVDREIQALKKEAMRLKGELATTHNEQKAKALQKQLAKIQQALQQKDNDTYRRQHTQFS